MNRILFEREEIVEGIVTFGGLRAEHVISVLHGEVGQILKTGEVNGPIGTSEIISISHPSSPIPHPSSPIPHPSSLITVKISHTGRSLEPWVDLILAPPRPRIMKRLLPQLAAMGVGRTFLVGAKKVEKDFWGATLLKEENYRPLLVDGLMQSGTSILPILEIRRNFRRFLNDELDALLPSPNRLVAHPYGSGDLSSHRDESQPLTLAIGPEGGWTDEEVELLEGRGFRRYSLGGRILRTDTATIALLAQLMPRQDSDR